MCKLSGNWKQIKAIAKISDGNNYIKSGLTINYWENAKCELKNNKTMGRLFKCEEITMEKIQRGRKTEYITVGCKSRVEE